MLKNRYRMKPKVMMAFSTVRNKQALFAFSHLLVVDRLVGQRQEILVDIDRVRTAHEALDQYNRNQVLPRIRNPRGAEPAVPAIAAGHRRDAVAACDDGN